ncbi:MAG: HEPN domain-containing protein [Muribaculaceae bacterium]|nr:HEPN domain-containing protein [Muribaculaceae bacterium]
MSLALPPIDKREELILYRISCSKNALDESDYLAANKMWTGAVNRLYYSCYYLVVALLLKYGLTAKSHVGVKSMLTLNFVKTDIISIESGKFFQLIFSVRHSSDYDDYISCDEDTYKDLRLGANQFFKEIRILLSK